MAALYTNNASTTLASGITNSATSLTVTSGNGTKFPSPTGIDYFMCTLQGASGTPIEIVKVTARSTDTFTIVRAQEGTTASAFNANDIVELRITAAEMTQINQLGQGNASIMKNRIINGAFYIAQRATSATLTAGSTIAAGYATVDRFYGYCTGANVTMAQVSGTGNNRNLLQFTGAASVTAIGCGQRIEAVNSYDMAGSTATLSAYIANSLLTSVTWTAYYANTIDTFGTLASPTRTQIATGTFTVTSTLTQYNAQISIPAAATTGIEIVFTVGAQTSGTFQLGLVQLEVGSSATGFEYRQYQQELALCQRYYEISTGTTDIRVYSGGNPSVYIIPYSFPVTMRTSPTVTIVNFSNIGGVASCISAAAGATGFSYRFTTSSTGDVEFYAGYTASAEL